MTTTETRSRLAALAAELPEIIERIEATGVKVVDLELRPGESEYSQALIVHVSGDEPAVDALADVFVLGLKALELTYYARFGAWGDWMVLVFSGRSRRIQRLRQRVCACGHACDHKQVSA